MNKSNVAICPHCGKGLVIQVLAYDKEALSPKSTSGKYLADARLPELTGSSKQCEQGRQIRLCFLQRAKKTYDAENYDLFLRLVSYEAHAIFWIGCKQDSMGKMLAKVMSNNPSAFELIK